ncbi:hydroxyisourate hydrolase [Aquipuribacter nitratireducens]|uniref:5-hydroxyisourate hydrolase n=1 Tax=Aquipuribacter nitratireducens TaxID=650104 RepID=A0ABW0GSF9_9MICO
MTAFTTHVLDAATGTPAAGVDVTLHRLDDGTWRTVGAATTDDDGRCRDLGLASTVVGTYRLTFATGPWFAAQGRATFFPEVVVTVELADPARAHHHVPLLLSPFAYSTYRGS